MDEQTLQFYGNNAQAYAEREVTKHTRLIRFLALLAPGATVLELGCGDGADSAEMLARGFDAHPTDGSPEMACEASRRLGRPVETLLFHDLDKVEAYDGVWANACLLHVPRPELAQVLALIWRALKPGGYFYASFKTGAAEGRDSAQSLLQLSDAGLAASHLRGGGQLEFTVDRDGRGQRLRRQVERRCCSSWRGKASDLRIFQTILKIASASTACARNPTVKASVRNTGRPSV